MLYQEVFQAAVTPARRAEWSRLIANGLAELNKADPSRVAAELAMHYEAGRDFQRAAHWFLQAARNAAQVYTNHEAADLCKRAINNADRLETGLRNAVMLDAAMLRAECISTSAHSRMRSGTFGLAEKAASDAGLVEASGQRDVRRRSRAVQSEADPAQRVRWGSRGWTSHVFPGARPPSRPPSMVVADGAHVRGRPRCGGTLEHLCAAGAAKRRAHTGSAARD